MAFREGENIRTVLYMVGGRTVIIKRYYNSKSYSEITLVLWDGKYVLLHITCSMLFYQCSALILGANDMSDSCIPYVLLV